MKTDIRKQLSLYLVLGGAPNRYGQTATEIAEAALRGGITMLQWREKKAPLAEVLETGRAIRDLCHTYRVPFIVNDRIDVAMLLGADGVHLGQEDIPLGEARKLLGDQAIIGISTGTFAEAQAAQAGGADYVGVGAIFATATKADAGEPIGTDLLTAIAQHLALPQVGIGGIQETNAASVYAAGADGIAVVSAITETTDVFAATRRLQQVARQSSV
jgi:thiamine-phosphate pyrophosphorylase